MCMHVCVCMRAFVCACVCVHVCVLGGTSPVPTSSRNFPIFFLRLSSVCMQGLIVSLLSIGAVFGALAAGTMSDTLGRKPTIIIGASLAALGGMLHTAAIHLGYM